MKLNSKIKKKIEIVSTNHLIIECKLNGINARFILDSGASNSCIDLLSVDKYGINSKKHIEKASSATSIINETFYSENNILEIKELKKINFNIFLFDMTFINNSLKDNGVEKVDGIIGGDIMREYKANINYNKRMLILEF